MDVGSEGFVVGVSLMVAGSSIVVVLMIELGDCWFWEEWRASWWASWRRARVGWRVRGGGAGGGSVGGEGVWLKAREGRWWGFEEY